MPKTILKMHDPKCLENRISRKPKGLLALDCAMEHLETSHHPMFGCVGKGAPN